MCVCVCVCVCEKFNLIKRFKLHNYNFFLYLKGEYVIKKIF